MQLEAAVGTGGSGEAMPAGADTPHQRLLIADDDSLVRSTLSMFALASGFEVVGTAGDGEQAIALAAATRPDAAVLDVDMPAGGMSAVRGVLEVAPETAIVMLSSDELDRTVRELLVAGACAYCRKGIDPDALADTLRRAIVARAAIRSGAAPVARRPASGKALEARRLKVPTAQASAVTAADGTLDPKTITQLRMTLSPEMRRQLHAGFRAVLPARLAAIESAIRSGDAIDLRNAAHLLRGTTITLGAIGLSELCKELETASTGTDPLADDELIARLETVGAQTRDALNEALGY
jgi:DNA-binding NarL/FixJ family response regulator